MAEPLTTTDQLARARGIARQVADSAGVAASFLGGSLVEGFGNATSDIDIYLLGDNLPASRPQLAAGHTRVDVHLLPIGQVETVLSEVGAATLPSDGSAPPFPESWLALAVRLRSAEVVTGAELIEPLRRRLADRHPQLRRLLMFRWFTAAHAELEDLSGLRDDGDCDAAAFVARSVLVAAGKAVAAAGDEFQLGAKWVWRQLDRSAPPQFPDGQYRRLCREDLGNDTHNNADWGNLVQSCLAAATTVGWQGVDLSAWPSWLSGAGPLARTPGYYPRAFDDAVVVTRPGGRRVRMRHEVALLWALCNDADEPTVLRQVAGLREMAPAYQNLSPPRCRQILRSLTEAGLLA